MCCRHAAQFFEQFLVGAGERFAQRPDQLVLIEITSTNTLRHALILVEGDGLSAAILDHSLGDGDSSILYQRLRERGIPFLIYSGFPKIEGACGDAPHISKPASHETLVTAMETLIRDAGVRR
jgi:hypothetical protein